MPAKKKAPAAPKDSPAPDPPSPSAPAPGKGAALSGTDSEVEDLETKLLLENGVECKVTPGQPVPFEVLYYWIEDLCAKPKAGVTISAFVGVFVSHRRPPHCTRLAP